MFWFVCKAYIFSIKWQKKIILRAMDLWFGSNFLQSFCSNEKPISFQLFWLIKSLIFDILSGSFLIFSKSNATAKAYWKQLSSLIFGFIVASLFFSYSVESIYDRHLFILIFWRWQNNIPTLSNRKLLPLLVDASKTFW